MRLKAFAFATIAGLVLGSFAAPAAVAGKKKKKAKSGPLVVATDAADDWGANQDPTLQPIGDALGMELTEAVIEMADKDTVNFIIKVNSLPAPGGAPEVARYSWNFNAAGESFELDGKFTNYSRGVCDPTSGSCPPPRDPGSAPFFVRGNCTQTENLVTCEEVGIVQATFDAAESTITIPVPLEVLGAKHGSKIAPESGIFGGTISAAPSAFLTYGDFPMDNMVATKTFVVSAKGKKKK
jgi:hypothetical protein